MITRVRKPPTLLEGELYRFSKKAYYFMKAMRFLDGDLKRALWDKLSEEEQKWVRKTVK